MSDELYEIDRIRTSHSPSSYKTSVWEYVNQTARPEFAAVRNLLNGWFARYPIEHRLDLKKRFQNKDNYQHFGALFELYCHELLLKHGYHVELHVQRSKKKTTRPDFFASRGNLQFFLEATILTKGDAPHKAILRRAAAFDEINSLELPQAYLSVGIDHSGANTLPPRVIRSFLEREYRKWRSDGHDSDNHLHFEWDGWRIEFRFIHSDGKKPESRNIGIEWLGEGFAGTSTALPRALERKTARKYDCESLPYVVAVNAIDEFAVDADDIVRALLGSSSRVDHIPQKDDRLSNGDSGAWFNKSGYCETGQSAVIFVQGLVDWTVFSANAVLLHHPAAAVALPPDAFRLSNMKVNSFEPKSYPWTTGDQACTILDIPTSLENAMTK